MVLQTKVAYSRKTIWVIRSEETFHSQFSAAQKVKQQNICLLS